MNMSLNRETCVNVARFEGMIVGELKVDIDQVTPEATFESLGADSLDTAHMIIFLEKEFDVEIDDDIASQITTLQDAFDYVEKCARCPEGLDLYIDLDLCG